MAEARELWAVPAEAPYLQQRLDGDVLVKLLGGQYRGWWLDLVGYLVSDVPPEPWPFLAQADGCYLWITRRQLWPPATSDGQRNVYLRADWEGSAQNDDLRETYSVGGLEWEHTKTQAEAAYAALSLFYERFRGGLGGRPTGETAWPVETFRPVFFRVGRDLQARLRRRPTQIEVYSGWPEDELAWSTFQRRWRQSAGGRPWADLDFLGSS